MYIAENTDHIYHKYDKSAYFKLNIAIFMLKCSNILYYALHFEHILIYYAGVLYFLVDISVQIAPNKEMHKSRPGCQTF